MIFDATKRVIDIVGATVGLIIFSPLFIGLAISIKMSSPGPVFFKPKRVGKGGKLFNMYKFRSMQMYKINGKFEHAHEILKIDKKMFEDYKANSFKLKNDPRVTPFGRFLRKSSLDELPQIYNILKGEMSIVGPRAYLPDELEEQVKVFPQTKPFVKTLLKAKPGLTGFWQVSGRSDINFDKRITMDVEYVKKRSILYDLELIFKTFPAIFTARGAV